MAKKKPPSSLRVGKQRRRCNGGDSILAKRCNAAAGQLCLGLAGGRKLDGYVDLHACVGLAGDRARGANIEMGLVISPGFNALEDDNGLAAPAEVAASCGLRYRCPPVK